MKSERVFFGVAALLFAGSAALTVGWCASMSSTGAMTMPGGWTMSMAWMRMPGETWVGAAVSFVAMWVVMMLAMMLPSLMPTLWRYRRGISKSGENRADWPTALVGAGYFLVWTFFGLAVFPVGAALAAIEMEQPALAETVPLAIGVVVLAAGLLQLTQWKVRRLACCRWSPGLEPRPSADPATAWRYGLRLGVQCTLCCAGLTSILLVVGVMDVRAMAAVTAAITVERFAMDAARAARVIGCIIVGAGLFLIAQAMVFL